MLKAELWGQLIESTGLDGTLTANAELAGSIGSGVEKINVSKTLQAETRHELPTTGESDKIYTDLATGTIYRFGGTTFVSISNPLDIASESEAKAGTDDTKAMTPKKVKIVVDNMAGTLEPKITSKGTAFNKDFGTEAGTVTEGNDPRLSDARTPKGAAGGDLSGIYPNPTIGAGKVNTAKIADGAVTDAKIAALSVMKLQINAGDTLILDGGTIE